MKRFDKDTGSMKMVCGFASPAEAHRDTELDLCEYLTPHPAATFFFRAAGDMASRGAIHHGDLLVVDRSISPVAGNTVIAEADGELTICTLGRNTKTPVNVWGVCTFVIHRLSNRC